MAIKDLEDVKAQFKKKNKRGRPKGTKVRKRVAKQPDQVETVIEEIIKKEKEEIVLKQEQIVQLPTIASKNELLSKNEFLEAELVSEDDLLDFSKELPKESQITDSWIRGVEEKAKSDIDVKKFSFMDAPTLEAFCSNESFINAVVGPFGSGKSSACVMNIVMKSMKQSPNLRDGVRRSRWLIVRNSYVQLRDTTIKTFFEWLPPSQFGKYIKNEQRYTITAFEGVEIEILFRALDRPDQVSNLLSLELTGAWLNEYREIAKEIFEGIQGRVDRYPPTKEGGSRWSGIIMDTNPPDEDSYYYKFFEEEDLFRDSSAEEIEAFRKIYKQPSGLSENAENLTYLGKDLTRDTGRVYYNRLCMGKDDDYIKVYVHGQYGFTKDGKPVYGNYVDSRHYKSEVIKPLEQMPIVVGMDFGLTPAAVFGQMTPMGGLVILDELVSDNMAIREFITDYLKPLIFEKYTGRRMLFVGDPAGSVRGQTDARTCYQELAAQGIKAVPAVTNSTIARINSVNEFLIRTIRDKPGFQISKTCSMTRKGFLGKYRYKKINVSGIDSKYKPMPEKNEYSHIHDAIQYMCLYFKHFNTTGEGETIHSKGKNLKRKKRNISWKGFC